jgi:hypothetical protein
VADSAFSRLQRTFVAGLEEACVWTGHRWGCRLASWSCALNNRWELDHWTGEGANNDALSANSVGDGGRWASAPTREVGTVMCMSSNTQDSGNIIERAEREQVEAWAELEALRTENERLRAQAELAHAILSSEQLSWLVVGSNHPEAQWAGIKPAISAYWEQYGNYFRPKGDSRG